jgi:macrolide transport system ATP-binding/permease protein
MIELRHVTKTYQMGSTAVRALDDVSLTIGMGDFVAIMGPSGSGKSTLLHVLGLLDRPDSGEYLFLGKDTGRFSDDRLALIRNRFAGFVFQQFHLMPRSTALVNTELPMIYSGRDDPQTKALEKLAEVGLSDRTSHRPNELSGGQQQRVAIARSLVNEPLIIFADEPTGNLDSKSEQEIVSLLEELNRKGKTVVLVTHERELAEHADRIIEMRDGRIISDEIVHADRRHAAPAPSDVQAEEMLAQAQAASRFQFGAYVRQALTAIGANKMRSALSMLGILIGVASVIAMLALGQGAKESIAQRLSSLGSNLLLVTPGSRERGGVALQAGQVSRLTLEDADAVQRLPDIRRVSPEVAGRVQLVYGGKNWNALMRGTGVEYAPIRATEPTEGRFFTPREVESRSKVALVGTTVAAQLYAGQDPVGTTLKINRINFQVIGVLPQKGGGPGGDQDDVVIVPVTTAMYRVLGSDYISVIDAEVDSEKQMDQATEAIRQLLIERHHLAKNDTESFQIRNLAEIQQAIESTTKTMTALLAAIAAISIVVGGIGIINIMLVSVTERTREIGLRKAIGARRTDILTQFLVESVVMTAIGGILGILLGAGAAFGLSSFAGWATRVSLTAVVLATSFSVVIGLVCGIWPAYQASKLDPITALRYE